MHPPDRFAWRQATGTDLWDWSWQGRGLFRDFAAPLVRVTDAQGRTVAVGLAVAYDMAEERIALLREGHQPGTALWLVAASQEMIWIQITG
ncbi:MAG: hypothetical protein K0R39_3936 [Symbiobacteriaceae bacterium]|jgi:hypothetical protein|nr:hypothetical protein [Symbiobacteriaceae bacterium]